MSTTMRTFPPKPPTTPMYNNVGSWGKFELRNKVWVQITPRKLPPQRLIPSERSPCSHEQASHGVYRWIIITSPPLAEPLVQWMSQQESIPRLRHSRLCQRLAPNVFGFFCYTRCIYLHTYVVTFKPTKALVIAFPGFYAFTPTSTRSVTWTLNQRELNPSTSAISA
jgi:hypothetical protein